MKFLSLSGKSLFSFAKFSIDLNNKGLVLITGFSSDEGSSNGSGKSSLVNKSLLWALFGQTAEGLKSDDVLNRHLERGDDALATLVFTVDKAKYRIERIRTRKGTTKLDFFRDGHCVSTRDVRSTQEMINKTIGRDLNSFIQTDFFGQGNSTPFMKLTTSGQKEVLERILPFEHLNEWLANTKLAKREVSTKKTFTEQKVNEGLAAARALQAQRLNIEGQHASWAAKKASTIKSLTDDMAFLQKSPEKIEIESVKKKLSVLDARFDMSTIDLSIFNKLSESTKLCARIADNKADMKDFIRELKILETMTENSTCSTCKQPVIIPDETQIINKLKIADLVSRTDHIATSLAMQQRMLELNTKIIAEWKEAKASNLSLLSRLVELNEEESTSKIKQIEAKLTELLVSTSPYVQTLEDADKTIGKIQLDIAAQQAKLVTIIEEEESVLIWEKAYSKDLRLLLYDRVCPFLTERANYHLQALNNAQITVNFSTTAHLKDSSTKEEFASTASSFTGGGSYSLLSGGEQQMVDFSVGLALSDLAATQVKSRSNLIILDEPFVGLDDRNCESVISYLKEDLAKIKSTIFLVSNEETLKGLIPNRVHVEKTGGISRVL